MMFFHYKIFDLSPCWLVHSIWHWILVKYLLEINLNLPALKMLPQVSVMQRSLFYPTVSWALAFLKIVKNSHFLYKVLYSFTKLILERITSFFSARFVNPEHNHTHYLKNQEISRNLQENVNPINNLPHIFKTFKMRFGSKRKWTKQEVKDERFCLQD